MRAPGPGLYTGEQFLLPRPHKSRVIPLLDSMSWACILHRLSTKQCSRSADVVFLGRRATLHLPHLLRYLHFRPLSRPSISQIRNETCKILETHIIHLVNLLLSSLRLWLLKFAQITKHQSFFLFKALARDAAKHQVRRFCRLQGIRSLRLKKLEIVK